MWDTETGEEMKIFKGHTNLISFMLLSKDQKILYSSSHDYTIKAWDVFSGEEIRTFEGHKGFVNHMILLEN